MSKKTTIKKIASRVVKAKGIKVKSHTGKSVIKKVSSKKTSSKKVKKGNDKKKEFELKTVKLLNKGRERGFVTYDEILKEFPNIETDVMFLDELYGRLSTSGIDVLEGGGMLDIEKEEEIECLQNELREAEQRHQQYVT